MDDALCGDHSVAITFCDRLLDALQRMFAEQLEHLNELTSSRQATMSLLEIVTQLAEFTRQLPASIHVRVIQIGWLASQNCEVMQWIQKHLTIRIRTCVPRDHLSVANDVNAIDVRLDHDG